MSKFMSKLYTGKSITVMIDYHSYTVDNSHHRFTKLLEALKKNDADMFLQELNFLDNMKKNIVETAESVGINNLKFENGEVYLNNEILNNVVSQRIKEIYIAGIDIKPMMLFLQNLLNNPSNRSVLQLFTFLEQCGLSITEDGCFLAYKAVRSDYFDKHSGKFHNKVGAVIQMPRNEVDDDPKNTCSNGLHVGALAYSGPDGSFFDSNDRCIIVKVNPRDVVCVPYDYSGQKMRVCEYTVVGDYKAKLEGYVYSGNVGDSYESKGHKDTTEVKNEIEIDSAHDILNGSIIKFYYDRGMGNLQLRHLLVKNVDNRDEFIEGQLVAPEVNAGSYRRFKMENMSNIVEID